MPTKNETSETEIIFTQDDVDVFARLSHDQNPLHMDPLYARKTPYGRPVVFGVLGAMKCLERWTPKDSAWLAEIQIEFHRPMFLDVPYRLFIDESSAHKPVFELRDGRRLLLRLVLESKVCPADIPSAGSAEEDISFHPLSAPKSLEGGRPKIGLPMEGDYQAGPAGKNSPQYSAWYSGAGYETILMMTSYLIGMECPGKQALFSKLTLRFEPKLRSGNSALRYKLAAVRMDEETGLLFLNLDVSCQGEIAARGELQSFVRQEIQPSSSEIVAQGLVDRKTLQDKTALVIGGSRGLGAALVQGLALSGCHVFLNFAKSAEDAFAVKKGLGSYGDRVTLLPGDAGDPAWRREVLDHVLKTNGKIDLLILNACAPPLPLDFSERNQSPMAEYIARNLALVQAPLAAMLPALEAASGTVVGISSVFAETGSKDFPHYAALKTTVEGLLRSAALAHKNIFFLAARPPRMATDMNNTPLASKTLMRPEIAATAIVNRLTEAGPGGTFEILDIFKSLPSEDRPSKTIGLAATFTVEPILPSLNFWKECLELPLRFEVAPYNQVFQELLSPSGVLGRNRDGLNVVILRFEDWLPQPLSPEGDRAALESHLENVRRDFTRSLKTFQSRSSGELLLLLCPSGLEEKDAAWRPVFKNLAESLARETETMSRLRIVDAAEVQALYPWKNPLDAEREKLGRIPYVNEYFNVLGAVIIRHHSSRETQPIKVIAIDCDNTLWRGVCEESGPLGISIDESHRRLHAFLIDQKNKGTLLCLCSKNREQAVWDVFDKNSAMGLKRQDFADWRVNWNLKSENLRDLAAALNVGLDSFLFIDDNPVECAEVRGRLPEVLTIQAPKNPEDWDQILPHLWPLDKTRATPEDKNRTRYYQEERERNKTLTAGVEFKDFIESLGLEMEALDINDGNIERVAELTHRTNQFNFMTKRRAVGEIQSFLNGGGTGFALRVKDRFGDYGFVGVLLAEAREGILDIDTCLLSCRVLGRGVEHRMASLVGEQALKKGLKAVVFSYARTPKNEPAARFLDAMASQLKGSASVDKTAEGFCLRVEAGALAGFSFNYLDAVSIPSVEGSSRERPKPPHGHDARRWEHQLESVIFPFSDPIKLAGAIGNQTTPSSSETLALEPAGSEDEVLESVKALFSRALSLPESRLDTEASLDSLVDDSYKNVELTVALRKEFGRVPHTVLFEARNLRDLAKTIYKEIISGHASHFEKILPSPKGEGRSEGTSERQSPPSFSAFKEAPSSSSLESFAELTPPKAEEPLMRSVAELPTPEAAEPLMRRLLPEKVNITDIAVVGMNGRYPGAETLDVFWDNLKKGVRSVGDVPETRWDPRAHFDPAGGDRRKSYSRRGAFLPDVDKFDAGFFNISPAEAQTMDPQQRIFLEVAWGLLEDAGYTRKTLGSNTGVFVGVISSDYALYAYEAALRGWSQYRFADFYQIPNRVSYFFDFQGPSLAVDSACSASGSALHLACESLRRGECEAALVGGINLILHPSRFIQYSQMNMISKTGLCAPFSAEADGTLFGEGAGAVLLKPLSRALRDRDNIHGIIKGSAVNAGGRTNGFTVPNPRAQARLITQAMRNAKVDPSTIGYVEAHGTGTSLGDPIEVRGLTEAFRAAAHERGLEPAPQYCALGSLKSNIGHLESGAAVAGLIKILLQMKHKTLAPSLNALTPNPKISFAETPFRVQQETAPWHPQTIGENGQAKILPRRAGLSSFGAGGANAHVIVEEYDASNIPPASPTALKPYELVVLSAPSQTALTESARRLASFIKENFSHLADLSYTLQVGREKFPHRLAIACRSLPELREKLSDFINDNSVSKGVWTDEPKEDGETRPVTDFSLPAFLSSLEDGEKWARHWFARNDTDWESLKRVGSVRKISLPGIVFNRRSYWIPDEFLPCLNFSARPVEASRFLGSRLSSPFVEGAVYQSAFDLENLPYLKDHRIYGRALVPGSMYVAYALTAVQDHFKGEAHAFKNVTFIQALTPAEGERRPIQFHLSRAKTQGEWLMELAGATAGKEGWTSHFTGQYQEAPPRQVESLDSLERIRERLSESMDPSVFYRESRAIGFEWGPDFQCVRELFRAEGEALGRVVLPPSLEKDMADCRIHPAFLDACFQVFVPAMDKGGPHEGGEAFLPLGVEEIHFYRRPSRKAWSHVNIVDARNKDSLRVDITLYDEAGTVEAHFKGMNILRARRNALEGISLKQKKDWRYTVAWEPTVLTSRAVNGNSGVALVLSAGGVERIFSESDAAHLKIVESIFPSDEVLLSSKLSQVLNGEGERGCLLFIVNPIIEQEPESALFPHCERLATLMKILERTRFASPPALWIVTRNAFSKTKPNDPVSGALWSLGRVIALEHPRFWGGMIDLPLNAGSEDWRMVLRAARSDAGEDHFQIRDGFHVPRLRPISTKTDENNGLTIRADGTYVITGAFGALGRQLTAKLTRLGAKFLVLVSRSGPTAAGRGEWETLKNGDIHVESRRLDVGDGAEVRKLFKELRGEGRAVRGVFHAAGVLEDGMFTGLDWPRFQKVLRPKAGGAWNLHLATREEPLDHFILFSSASSLLGAPGQANYAVANGFLDALASHRRALGLPALSVNWGPWAGAGMAANANAARKIWTNESFGSIDGETGWALLGDLAGGQDAENGQAAVLPYQWKELFKHYPAPRVSSLLKDISAKHAARSEPQAPSRAGGLPFRKTGATQGERRTLVTAFLRGQAAEILGFSSPDQIDAGKSFLEMGFDSLMALSFRTKLAQAFDCYLPATLIFDHPTLKGLAEYICRETKWDQAAPVKVEIVDLSPSPAFSPVSGKGDLNSSAPSAMDAEAEREIERELEAVEKLLV